MGHKSPWIVEMSVEINCLCGGGLRSAIDHKVIPIANDANNYIIFKELHGKLLNHSAFGLFSHCMVVKS